MSLQLRAFQTVARNGSGLLTGFGRVLAQFFQEPQQCQPFVF